MIRRCTAHACHYDTRWGCPMCPNEFDALVVALMRENAKLEAALQSMWKIYQALAAENRELRASVPRDTVDAYVRVLDACCRALDHGGVSAGRLAEMIGARVGDLYRGGLQRVANALYDAANPEGEEVPDGSV